MSKLYNKKIKLKCFAEGDLVWKVILSTGTKTAKFSKWSSNWEGPFIVTKIIYGRTYKLATRERDELARSINDKYIKKYYPIMLEAINIYKNQNDSHKPVE